FPGDRGGFQGKFARRRSTPVVGRSAFPAAPGGQQLDGSCLFLPESLIHLSAVLSAQAGATPPSSVRAGIFSFPSTLRGHRAARSALPDCGRDGTWAVPGR